QPERNRGGVEDAPEEKQLRRVAEKSRRQTKIKCAADGGLVGQPHEKKGIAENQQSGGGKLDGGVGEMKTRHGQRQPQKRFSPARWFHRWMQEVHRCTS